MKLAPGIDQDLEWKCSRCNSFTLETPPAESTRLSDTGQTIISETGNFSLGLSIGEDSTEATWMTGREMTEERQMAGPSQLNETFTVQRADADVVPRESEVHIQFLM